MKPRISCLRDFNPDICHHGRPRGCWSNPHRLTSFGRSVCTEQIQYIHFHHLYDTQLCPIWTWRAWIFENAPPSIRFSSALGTMSEGHHKQLNPVAGRQMKIGTSSIHYQYCGLLRLRAKLILWGHTELRGTSQPRYHHFVTPQPSALLRF